MNTEPRCPICDFKALWIVGREQAFTMAIDMGAKLGLDACKSMLCKGHRDAWEANVVNGMTMLVKMIQGEAEEIRRLREEGQ